MLVLLIVIFNSRNDDIVKGGENIIVDAFPTVEDFRTKHPQHFHTLTTIPGTFQRIWKHRYISSCTVALNPAHPLVQ